MELRIETGKCETCSHAIKTSFDPSPRGVSLSPGTMEDIECGFDWLPDGDDEIPESVKAVSSEKIGTEIECPVWGPRIGYCHRHNRWYYDDECAACESEMDILMN